MSRWWNSFDFVLCFSVILGNGEFGRNVSMADFEEGLSTKSIRR
jgi:hypothetical protein